jgi:hypothetical protein
VVIVCPFLSRALTDEHADGPWCFRRLSRPRAGPRAGRSRAARRTELFLSQPTVKTHVSRVLPKLQLRDRVHAVVLAYECGLVRPGAG